MRKIVILLILISNMISLTAVTPLDSLFVSAVMKANRACSFTDISESYLYDIIKEKGKAITSYRQSSDSDTIYIISDFPLEGGIYCHILTPKWEQTTDLNYFEYSYSWRSIKREDTPELEWIQNWEPDSLKKYGIYYRGVRDGIAERYVVRYIIKNDSIRADSVKYVPTIDMLYDWSKWRKQKYGY